MPSSKTYGVFLPGKKWGRTNSLAEAKKAVDRAGSGEIRSINRAGNNLAYDSHTFMMVSDKVPYSPKKIRIRLTKQSKKRGVR